MSHKATYWLATLDPDLVKAGAFRVLFHLCDYHNDERSPEAACFPAQETLMKKTNLSNGGLNNCLTSLEEAGVLRRIRGTAPNTSTRRTYYILGCDFDADTTQTPKNGDSANSSGVEAGEKLTPLSGQANSTLEGGKLQPTGDYPVKEPKRIVSSGDDDEIDFYSQFLEAHPRPRETSAAETLFQEIVDGGFDPLVLIDAARAYGVRVASWSEGFRDKVQFSDNWLADSEKWERHKIIQPAERPNLICGVSEVTIKAIQDGKRALCSSVTGTTARQLVEAGHVTPEQCKAAGVNL